MPLHRFLTAFVLLLVAFAARAQTTWTAVTTPTTSDLWGVTWGGGQFVAVGQAGTILTSPDGTTWTARTSGTSAWLLAVTYSAELKQYVAVGDGGTLLTSTDAVTWTPATSGTTERLNGIATGGGRILAVGEHSTILTSTDGATWTVAKVPVAGWLRGVAYVSGSFLIGGSAYDSTATPMPNYVTTEGQTFSDMPDAPMGHATEAIMSDGMHVVAVSDFITLSPASFPLQFSKVYAPPGDGTLRYIFSYVRGILLFNDTWVAAGTDGVIFSAFPDGGISSDRIKYLDRNITFTALAANTTTAVAVGSGGAIYRSPADPKTAPVLTWNDDKPLDSITVGSTVTLKLWASGAYPTTYQWFHDGQPIPGATTPTLVLANLQQAQRGTYTLTATNALGTTTSAAHTLVVVTPLTSPYPVDPTFSPPAGAIRPVAVGDGNLLLTLNAADYSSQQLVRVDHAGQVDAGFHRYSARTIGFVQPQPDGKILVADNTALRRLNADGTADPSFSPIPYATGTSYQLLADGRTLNVTVKNNTITFQRYLTNGTIDASYAPQSIILPPPDRTNSYAYSSALIAPDGAGYVVAAVSGVEIFYSRSSRLFRVGSDGTVDSEMGELPISIVQLVATDAYFYYVIADTGARGMTSYSVGRATRSLVPDSTYHPQILNSTIGAAPLVRPDGGVSTIDQLGSIYEPRPYALRWYKPDGTLDASIGGALTVQGATLFWTSTGELYAGGGYDVTTGSNTTMNGVATNGLARLVPNLQPASNRLTNVSVRQTAGTGSATLTLGFCIAGDGKRSMLLRGVGPTLAEFKITNFIADPRMELWDTTSTRLLSNDDWWTAGNVGDLVAATDRVGAFGLPDQSKDAAALVPLAAGTYSVQLNAAAGSGVAMVEGYDASDAAPADMTKARIVNFSARSAAGTGEQTLILGFSIDGPGLKRLLIRGVGPSLTQFGVTGVLADPAITLYHGNTVIAWNNDATASSGGGAFPLRSARDAALTTELAAGTYTVQVNGDDGGTGIALLEIYELP